MINYQYKIKSFCKINLSLRVLKKNSDGYHSIQSYVVFSEPCDYIYISKYNGYKDKITFKGKFKKSINSETNTITKTLKILRSTNILKKIFFKILVKKNIPQGAGLGGGSSDAAALINFISQKINKKINKKIIYNLASKIGSDVPLLLNYKNSIVNNRKSKILRLKHKFKFYVLIVYPQIVCSTRKVYLKNKQFSLPKSYFLQSLRSKKNIIKYLKSEHNDLENIVTSMYPKIKKMIDLISDQRGCYFSRLTGSGSACIGLFSSFNNANQAKNIVKRNFPNVWCKVSKTI